MLGLVVLLADGGALRLVCIYGAMYSFSYAQSKERCDKLERFTWEDYSGRRPV